MSSKTRIALALAVVALLSAGIWWARAAGQAPKGRVDVAGKVRSDVYTVAAPAIAYPTPDYTVGVQSAKGAAATGSGAGASSAAGMGGSGASGAAAKAAAARPGSQASGRLATVTVRQGDTVAEGDVVARLDTRLLDLAVRAAEDASRKSRADVGLMSDNLDTIANNRSKLANAQSKLASGRAKLLSTQAQLQSTRASLVAARAKALAGRSAISAQIAQLESIPTTLTPQQQAMLAGLKQKLAQVNAGIAKIDAGLVKIDAGLAKIAAALAKLPSAEKQLSTAKNALSTAKTQVTNARDTLRIVANARDVAVELAKQRRAQAVITAPVGGVVTFARPAGVVVMVGAPVVRIRPDSPQLIDTYLTAQQLGRITLDSPVKVSCDSLPGRTFDAAISSIGVDSEFPPTNFPTDIVHMTRTVRVTATLAVGANLPPGTPVDLSIRPE